MGMYLFGGFKVLKGTEVEAPRIIPPNHTPLYYFPISAPKTKKNKQTHTYIISICGK